MRKKRKIILVGFNKHIVSKEVFSHKINQGKYIPGRDELYLSGYVYHFTQLLKNSGVFFDYIFEYIDKGIKSNNCLDDYKGNKIDCYPLLISNLNNMLKGIGGVLLIIKNKDNKYKYLLDILDIGKVYIDTNDKLITYLKHL